ncbi:hypothetical protein F511_17382 [Dorcoceras hygrometricum]|uniref:Uncharacterized protein n=1 Tax=Dorcoceras hygrometricum TaxID=472368 RepID=A0A2Z7B0H0_9LAMI|nr:hypothetical protein F511_17382 [Dorcoceras hygrometricum]
MSSAGPVWVSPTVPARTSPQYAQFVAISSQLFLLQCSFMMSADLLQCFLLRYATDPNQLASV